MPWGLSPLPLLAKRRRGAAACIPGGCQCIMCYVAQKQGASLLSIGPSQGAVLRFLKVEPWQQLQLRQKAMLLLLSRLRAQAA